MKITLVCSAGMSTSLLVTKMREAAEKRHMEAEIQALAEADLKNHADGIDVLLIGPQVRYLQKKIRKQYEPQGIKIDVIDQMAYGLVNGEKVLDQAIQLLEA